MTVWLCGARPALPPSRVRRTQLGGCLAIFCLCVRHTERERERGREREREREREIIMMIMVFLIA